MAKKSTRRRRQPPPQFSIVGELYDELENDLMKDLLELPPRSEVSLYFDTSGGSVYSALAIVALLRHRKLRATGIVLGECSSAAVLVFAACVKRFVTPHSVLLFHRVRWRTEKDMRREEAANWASHFEWLEREVDRYQAELFGRGQEEMQKWIEESRFVLGPELVKLGVAELLDV